MCNKAIFELPRSSKNFTQTINRQIDPVAVGYSLWSTKLNCFVSQQRWLSINLEELTQLTMETVCV